MTGDNMKMINQRNKRNRQPIDIKSIKLQIRVTEAERASLKKRAALLNMTMSDYVRSFLWKESEGMKHEV